MSEASCYALPALIRYLAGSPSLGAQCQAILGAPQEMPEIAWLAYLGVFFLTCLLEAPFFLWALWGRGFSWPRRLGAILLPNLLTHPVVCFAIPYLMRAWSRPYGDGLALGELFAPAVEAALLAVIWKTGWKRAIPASIAANLFSWWVGIYLIV